MNPANLLNSALNRLPPVRALRDERDALLKAHGIAPPGHFYSPIVSIPEITRDQARVFAGFERSVPGIDMNEAGQLALLDEFITYYKELPFADARQPGRRYQFDNTAYSYSDAIMLYSMIRHAQPRTIVEVGSGHSSCAMLDTNELFFDNRIRTLFVEPYPQLLESLITADDRQRITLLPTRLQDVDSAVFTQLVAGDILFIDSTHVAKAGSDVNRLFFEVLPSLQPGVFVHIHDVFYPFEYPRSWVLGGRSWNELYLLRAFLQHNTTFKIVMMNTFMQHFHQELFREKLPLCLKNTGGSIWLQRVQV